MLTYGASQYSCFSAGELVRVLHCYNSNSQEIKSFLHLPLDVNCFSQFFHRLRQPLCLVFRQRTVLLKSQCFRERRQSSSSVSMGCTLGAIP